MHANGAVEPRRRHVAVMAFPFGTHAGPLLSLTRRLSAAGPNLKFSFFSTAKSNGAVFKGAPCESIKPYDVDHGLPEGYVFRGNPVEPIEYFLKVARESFRKGLELAVAESGAEIDCLISDAFLWFVGEMAEEMNVPWVPLWTAGPVSLLSHVETELIRQTLGHSGFEEKTMDFIPGFARIREIDLPEGVVRGNLESPFAIMLHKMGQTLPKAKAIAINSFEEIAPDTLKSLSSKFQKFLNIGPFNLTPSPPQPPQPDEHGCLTWLNKHGPHSVAYISLGSYIIPPPDELGALADALEETKFPFLWSFRGNPKEKLPMGFLERTKEAGKFVPWAPQEEVLRHSSVGVFVTHGGWNSVMESITGGVPMMCRAFIGDQKLNMRVVDSVWGIGLEVEEGVFTKRGVVSGLEKVLLGKEGKEMREKIDVLKKLAFKAVEINGSSTQNFNFLVEEIITA